MPIFGGRQNEMARLAGRVAAAGRLAAAAGHAYRQGRRQTEESEEDEEDEEYADDDVFPSYDEDEEGENEYDLFDSFINDTSLPLVNISIILASDDDSDEDDDNPAGDAGDTNSADETFSREVEEFELIEERENKAAKKAEERLRKKEDKEEKENKQALRTDMFGACTVCAEDEVTDPVGCIYCANFIGCRKCAKRWYRSSQSNSAEKLASCPLCRHQWMGPVPEVGDMLDLVKTA